VGQWRVWYARFRHLLRQHTAREDKAGTLARCLARECELLVIYLNVPSVDITNKAAEWAHRFGVRWHKRNQRTSIEKGHRWVEQV
jgi:hypothetical protein